MIFLTRQMYRLEMAAQLAESLAIVEHGHTLALHAAAVWAKVDRLERVEEGPSSQPVAVAPFLMQPSS